MAHAEQFEFVSMLKAAFPDWFSAVRVLEIGSLDINGSIRQFFDGGLYTGLDVAPGRGVDIVCPGQDFDAPADSFDTVISCEAMEHNPHWKATMLNMIRMCRPGGLVVMTCATTGRWEHGTTRTSPADSPLTVGLGWEYYLNLAEKDLRAALPLDDEFALVAFFDNWSSRDIYMIGFKRGAPVPVNAEAQLGMLRDYYRRANIRCALTSGYLSERLFLKVFGDRNHRALQRAHAALRSTVRNVLRSGRA